MYSLFIVLIDSSIVQVGIQAIENPYIHASLFRESGCFLLVN